MSVWTHRRLGRSLIAGVVLAAAAAAGEPGAARADDIAVIQEGDSAQAGMSGRQPITPPGPGYTRVKAESDDPDAVQVDTPNVVGGGAGFSYAIKNNAGRPVVITVTWLDPKTGDKRYQFFVVIVKDKEDVFPIHYGRTGAVTVFMRNGKAAATLPVDRVPTDTENGRDFLSVPAGGAGEPGYDRTHPATVWFTHTGLALYQYEYTLNTEKRLGLFVINVVEPAKAPGSQPNKTGDDKGKDD